MRLRGNLITSLASLRENFDLREIWANLTAAVRDLAPDRIFYPSDDGKVYYQALRSPETAKLIPGGVKGREDDVLSVGGETFSIRMSDSEREILAAMDGQDRIRMVAIHLLAGRPVTEEALRLTEMVSDGMFRFIDPSYVCRHVWEEGGRSDLLLEWPYGSRMAVGELIPGGNPLKSVVIRVPENSRPLRAGDCVLNPGEATYGVFQEVGAGNGVGLRLVAVSPVRVGRSLFLQFDCTGAGMELTVRNRSGAVVRRYGDAVFCALVGNEDYAVINGCRIVSSSETFEEKSKVIHGWDSPMFIRRRDEGHVDIGVNVTAIVGGIVRQTVEVTTLSYGEH